MTSGSKVLYARNCALCMEIVEFKRVATFFYLHGIHSCKKSKVFHMLLHLKGRSLKMVLQ